PPVTSPSHQDVGEFRSTLCQRHGSICQMDCSTSANHTPRGRRTRMTLGRSCWRRVAAGGTLATAIAVGVSAAAVAGPPETDPKSIARDPDYIGGKWAIDAREWSEAVNRLERASRRDPDNADLHNYLGFAYRNLGRLEPALEHYQRAL